MKNKSKTSLPPSIKKSISNKTSAPPAEKKETPVHVNLDPLLDIRDRAQIHPEEIKIQSFRMNDKTRGLVLKAIGIKVEEYDGYLYGYRVVASEGVAYGKINVMCGEDSEITNVLTVIES